MFVQGSKVLVTFFKRLLSQAKKFFKKSFTKKEKSRKLDLFFIKGLLKDLLPSQKGVKFKIVCLEEQYRTNSEQYRHIRLWYQLGILTVLRCKKAKKKYTTT